MKYGIVRKTTLFITIFIFLFFNQCGAFTILQRFGSDVIFSCSESTTTYEINYNMEMYELKITDRELIIDSVLFRVEAKEKNAYVWIEEIGRIIKFDAEITDEIYCEIGGLKPEKKYKVDIDNNLVEYGFTGGDGTLHLTFQNKGNQKYQITEYIQNTNVSFTPDYLEVEHCKNFSLFICCEPGTAIKAWEMNIEYDEETIQSISVDEGDIFEGYQTFFNSGTVDEINGTIKQIYNLIVGPGNVTLNGTLIKLNFMSLDITGLANINIYGLGITNETQYVPVSYENARVFVSEILQHPRWDLNQDGIIDVTDISLIFIYYGVEIKPPGNKLCDVNIDGFCDITDLSKIVMHYGESY